MQSEWDAYLLTAFYQRPRFDMKTLVARWGHPDVDLMELKRTPKHIWHWSCTPERFISGYLPKISKILWDNDEKIVPRIVGALKNSSMDTLTTDKTQRREKYEVQASAKKYRHSRIEHAQWISHKEATNRSWHVVK